MHHTNIHETDIAPMSGGQRWRRIAWAIGAHDLALDPFPEPGSNLDDAEAQSLRDWAETEHGSTARLALAVAEAIRDTEPADTLHHSCEQEAKAMTFAVEEAEGRGYKRVHRAGCRDLRDPETVGAATTLAELLGVVDGYCVADDLEELDEMLAPCARPGITSRRSS